LAVGSSASVLLQAGVGNTAFTTGNRSTAVLTILAGDQNSTARSVAHTLSVDDTGGGNGSEAENNGGDGELHFELVRRGVYLVGCWAIDCDEEEVGCEMD
jgi:hypothetical protein